MEYPYSIPMKTLLAELETDPKQGLTNREAAARLERNGPNRLDEPPGKGMLSRLWEQFKDPMILVLLAAAVLSVLSSGDWVDAGIILLIVVVNAIISITQESGAEKALAALQQMSAPQAKVIREGTVRRLDAALVVPGDVVTLEAGDYVPADGRIIESAGLKTDESAITGESVPVEKLAVDSLPVTTAAGDRRNMLIGSTMVTAGRATMVITGTGMDTEVGRIASMLMGQEENETPLRKKMTEISKTLSFLCLGVCAVLFGVGLIQGKDLLGMLLIAVSLAVAAIPEGLPAIVTIVLALGVREMAQRHAIVKRLPAVETLGCASVICSDKTGTLTRNKMTVQEVWTAYPSAQPLAWGIGCLCCDVGQGEGGALTGDPTETAIVEGAKTAGIDKFLLDKEQPRLGEIPFDSERKLMSTLHPNRHGGVRVMVKGGPDVLLNRCAYLQKNQKIPLNSKEKGEILRKNEQMAEKALRVIAVAYRELSAMPERLDSETVERDLIFVGLIGMMDPPREEARQAVTACHRAGIRPVMITGDHRATAVAVAQELGIYQPGDLAMTGAELDFLPEELLEEQAERCSVYARVSPEHKLRIVSALQRCGRVVAMTGDGVNDAPALKAADIGCAMGITGTDVAKGAADMILTDDDFSTIVAAVEQGRGIYANIRKSIQYLLSCNIGEILTIFLATVLNFHQMPLVPVQLLWLNLVTDSLPALALGVEPIEEGVMERPPRDPSEGVFSRGMGFAIAWQGALVGLVTLAAYFLGEYILSDPGEAYQAANTMAFATLTLSQLFHAWDVRSDTTPILSLGLTSNPAMVRAFLVGLGLQLFVMFVPLFQHIFSVVPLNGAEWCTVLALSLIPAAVCDWVK